LEVEIHGRADFSAAFHALMVMVPEHGELVAVDKAFAYVDARQLLLHDNAGRTG
jgi:hypothetical protein